MNNPEDNNHSARPSVLVCGSISYDHIMEFNGYFADSIFPNKQAVLNVAFYVDALREELGGCAANICHSLNLMGCQSAPVSSVGNDFARYSASLKSRGISQDYILTIDDLPTARDHITTDRANHQIASFYAGAMRHAKQNRIKNLEGVKLGVIAPDEVAGMLAHAETFAQANIPILFDPGPVTSLLSKGELLYFVEKSRWMIFNQHEWNVFQDITELGADQLIARVDAFIVTQGARGSTIYTQEKLHNVLPVEVALQGDPTGCGDAYRAGLVFSLLGEYEWEATGRLCSLVSSYCYRCRGAQNHHFDIEALRRDLGDGAPQS